MSPGRMDADAIVDPDGRLRALPERYQLCGLLRAGAQKRVYLARDERDRRDVVVAQIDAGGLRRTDLDAIHEIAALAHIGAHPHILDVLEVVETGRDVFLVLPFMEGGDVEALLEASDGRRLPIGRVLELGVQLCSALDHAHRHRIVHGDVKPSNLLLDGQGRLRLGDFGLARSAVARAPESLAGTLAYLSPEQIRGEASGPASDLYALGCVLYELLTGAPPFIAQSAAELMNLHQLGRAREVQSRRPATPVSLSLLVAKLLEKDPAARPASAAETQAALDGALRAWIAFGSASGETRPGRLVARDAELEVVTRAAAQAREGRPRVLLVSGEAGIGKTQLLERAAAAASQAGSLVLYGLCGGDLDVPHRPIVDALLPLAGHLSELPEAYATRLREFLYLGSETQRRTTLAERGVDQQRLFVSIFTALTSLSQNRPIVLILEDLHQADSASLDLFEYLAWASGERAEHERLDLLLVGSFREADGPSLRRLVEVVEASPRATHLVLEPLRESATIEMLRALGIENPSRRLAEELYRASRGNPLFLREIVHRLEAQDAFYEQGGATIPRRALESFGLPQTVIDAVGHRLESVGADALEALRIAALLGSEFELRSAPELAAGPMRPFLAGLDEAAASGLLSQDAGRFHFPHPLVREVMAASIAPDERERLHRWLADYWQAADDREPGVRELEIARHLMQAGTLAEPAELARHTARAADHALAKFAWAEAAHFLEAALDAVPSEADAARSDLLRAELHGKAGFAYFRRLDPGPCLHHYERAAALFREQGDRRRHAQALNDRVRALVWLGMNDLSTPVDAAPLREALEALDEEPRELRAAILSTLAEYAWSMSRTDEAETLALEAMALTDPQRDHLLRAEISINLGLARQHAMRGEEAIATWRLGAVHGRQANDLSSTARCLQRVHMALFAAGRVEEALRVDEEVAAMNRILQLPGEAAIASGVRASIAAVRGDHGAVEKHAGESIDLVRRAKYPWAMMFSAPILAYARAMRGDSAGAHRAIDLLVDPKVTFSDSSHFAGLAYSSRWLVDYYVGEPVRISLPERDLLAQSVAQASADLTGLTVACLAVEIADAVQEPRLAAVALPLVEKAARQGGAFTIGWPFFLPRILGAAEKLAGRWDLAERSFTSALEHAARIRAPAEVGRTRLDLAQLLALRNGDDDRKRATELARTALAELRTCSESVFASRAEKLCSYLGR